MKIKRTHKKSFFVKMHYNSVTADSLFTQNPMYKGKYVKVLQVHKFSQILIMMEVVYQQDLDIIELSE